jgi:lysophospholipase L1-like esterase
METRRRRTYVLGIGVATLAAVAALLFGGGSQAAPGHSYLALGDSVTFGYITQAGFEYGNPENFVGFPDYGGDVLRLQTVNASCPGETTASFLSATGVDNGCRSFRSQAPLHVAYTGTQLDYATTFLTDHPNTSLVTIQLGANDAFVLQRQCAGDPTCIAAGLPAVLASISANMDTILRDLRATGFHGVLMVVNYYSLDYGDAAGTALTRALNAAVTAHAQADGAVVADAFTAFQTAAGAAGHTCQAGLLNASPQNQFTCDVHPSQSGQKLLAQVVENRYSAATGG